MPSPEENNRYYFIKTCKECGLPTLYWITNALYDEFCSDRCRKEYNKKQQRYKKKFEELLIKSLKK